MPEADHMPTDVYHRNKRSPGFFRTHSRLVGQGHNSFNSNRKRVVLAVVCSATSNPLIVDLLRKSTPTTLRVLDAIGRSELANGITISEQFHIPRGTVSKITRRLVAKDHYPGILCQTTKKDLLPSPPWQRDL